MTFTNQFCVVLDPTSRILIFLSELCDWVYVYKALPSTTSVVYGDYSIELWHKRMGHQASQSLPLICVAPNSSSNKRLILALMFIIVLNMLVFPFLLASVQLWIIFNWFIMIYAVLISYNLLLVLIIFSLFWMIIAVLFGCI